MADSPNTGLFTLANAVFSCMDSLFHHLFSYDLLLLTPVNSSLMSNHSFSHQTPLAPWITSEQIPLGWISFLKIEYKESYHNKMFFCWVLFPFHKSTNLFWESVLSQALCPVLWGCKWHRRNTLQTFAQMGTWSFMVFFHDKISLIYL